MNADPHESTSRKFAAILERSENGTSEDVLQEAYELGRWAWGQGMGVVQITILQYESLAAALERVPTREMTGQVVRNAALLSAECFSVFEMAMRGFQESNAALTEMNRKLEAANRDLDSFSYSVSHDLRTPLRAIDGFTRAILEEHGDKLDGEARHLFDRVRAATQRMGQLIDDLLGLSRITRSPLRRETTDVTALARRILADLAEADRGRQVEARVAEGLVTNADPRLLTAAFENLLGNAWKFTKKQTQASIEVGKEQRDDGDVFFVRDNGAGFEMEYAAKLFSPFQRLHSDAEFPGTGIGLATVNRIIQRHGGSIWAEAARGRGATFFFTLGAGS